jgi:hypothetical protein
MWLLNRVRHQQGNLHTKWLSYIRFNLAISIDIGAPLEHGSVEQGVPANMIRCSFVKVGWNSRNIMIVELPRKSRLKAFKQEL